VLGWRPKGDDPRGFVGALTQSFALKEVEGHTEWTWTPRTYAVQTDLAGGITGAQASLYTRAKDALDQALPLLDGLYPLRVDADPQDMEALRATVHSQMTEIVNELGISGGPRVSRIDQLFLLLLGGRLQPEPGEIVTEPDDVEPGSQLGTLREEFGLATTDDLVNTVEEEQNLTNFRILADYLIGLRLSWVANRRFFTRVTGTTPFFGTQLVLLSRQLSVIVESVDEVRFALDSVFIGPSERQTLELVLGGREDEPLTRMFVEELLSWVSSFASEEGPRVIQDGGKHGVQTAFLPVVETLQLLVDGATHPANPTDLPLPKGYYTLRVQRSLQELRDQLKELVKLASSITHQVPPESTLDQINAQVKALQTRIDQFRRP